MIRMSQRVRTCVVCALSLLCLLLQCPAWGQERGEAPDVLFFSSWTNFYDNAFNSYTEAGADCGRPPAPEGWTQTCFRQDTPMAYRLMSATVNISGDTATFNMQGLVHATVIPVNGIFHGGGQSLSVSVYVLGPAGTPYSLTSAYSGTLEARRSNGVNGVSAFFEPGGYVLGGAGNQPISILPTEACRGTTSAQHPPNGDTRYTLAGTVSGWFLGRSTFSFNPFGGMAPFVCESECDVTCEIRAGVGECEPMLVQLDVLPPAERAASSGNADRFDVTQVVLGPNIEMERLCACCEYRQCVRSRVRMGQPGHERPIIVPNADGQPIAWPGYVEDSYCSGPVEGECQPVRYGHRTDDPRGNNSYSDPNQHCGCFYAANDGPGLREQARGLSYCFEAEFLGRVIDVCQSSKPGLNNPCGPAGAGLRVVAEYNWRVCFSGVVGDNNASPNCRTCRGGVEQTRQDQVGNRMVGTTFGKDRSTWWGSTTFARLPDEPPFDPDMVSLRLLGLTPTMQGSVPATEFVYRDEGTVFAAFSFEPPDPPPEVVPVVLRVGADEIQFDVDFSDLQPPCFADFNGDGVLSSDDYFAFLADFFAGVADFNDDGVTNSDDFFAFLIAFFAGCG